MSDALNLSTPEPWIVIQSQLCENPLWDVREQILYWTDIDAGRLYRYIWKTGQTESIYQGSKVGGFTLQEDGSLLLFREMDMASLTSDGKVRVLRKIQEDGDVRFNDVAADPEGRVFAGTIGRSSDSGSLYRFERDGSYHRVAAGTGCSNGITFSLDMKTLYWVCSTRRKIFAFPYLRESGELGESTVFLELGKGEGIPDGLTSDAKGNLYSIRWAAPDYGLVVLDANAQVLGRVKIPAYATSSACFCGPDLRSLVVTSAQHKDEKRPADLFLIKNMPYAGREEFRSRIAL